MYTTDGSSENCEVEKPREVYDLIADRLGKQKYKFFLLRPDSWLF